MKLKNFAKILSVLLLVCLCFTSCSAEGAYNSAVGGGDKGGGSILPPSFGDDSDSFFGSADEDYASGAAEGDKTEGDDGEVDGSVVRPAGLITASAFNDNDYYDYWKSLFEQGEQTSGKFVERLGKNSWNLNSLDRIKVTVKVGDEPVAGAAAVAYSASGEKLFSAVTNASGVAYLFCGEGSGTVRVSSSDFSASAEFTPDVRELTLSLDGAEEKRDIIDIMFVVDVTGSMGDELSFLQNEIADVIDRIAKANADAIVNLALLFYRDECDREQFLYYDFVNVTTPVGLASVQAALESCSATGGGDYPESVDEALLLATEKQWSSAAGTKLIFHILDAPPHSTDEDIENYSSALLRASELGIRICPILCSGADELTEYLTRQAAIYTGGTFIFVTDDSGIGGTHHDPGIPNVTVEALNSLIVRLVNGYHSGTFSDPIDWRQEVK